MVSVISNDKSFKDLGKIVGYVDVKCKHRIGKRELFYDWYVTDFRQKSDTVQQR